MMKKKESTFIGSKEGGDILGVSPKTFRRTAAKLGITPIIFRTTNGSKFLYVRALVLQNREKMLAMQSTQAKKFHA